MCGIAGIVAIDGFEPSRLVDMTQMIHYRGPSGYGFAYTLPGTSAVPEILHNRESAPFLGRPVIGLGNRRLAILDLSENGNQPMLNADGSFCLTYNGEIYNYRELRAELESLGHRFSSNTDTEVLLHSYQQWGEDCLNRFNGMWSFALWDRNRQRLFCARDRLGVKPFYFAQTDRAFFFGSEIKQVLAASGAARTANPQIVSAFLEFGLQDHSSETAFVGVHQLLGGHSLLLEIGKRLQIRTSRYWELPSEPELQLTARDAADEFRARFKDAVRIRLRSDVAVGVSLSGGLDSSAILCQARELSPETSFRAFSACFEQPEIDERSYIAAITSATNAQRHWSFPQSESFWSSVEKIAYHQDEPMGGPSVFAQWSVMQQAREQSVPVLLGGQGGDESLCGYGKYYLFYLWQLLRSANPRFLSESFSLATHGSHSHWSIGTVSRYLPPVFRNRVSALRRLATPALREAARDSRQAIGAAGSIAERQKIDLLAASLPKLLRHEDRNSMAHSVETRMPFLDYRLVELAVRCPPSYKLRDGWTKWILREAMTGTLPDAVRLRKTKLGFNTPDAAWLQSGLRNGHRSLWQSRELRAAKYLDPQRLAAECQLFLDGSVSALPPEILFRAISLEIWARVHRVD